MKKNYCLLIAILICTASGMAQSFKSEVKSLISTQKVMTLGKLSNENVKVTPVTSLQTPSNKMTKAELAVMYARPDGTYYPGIDKDGGSFYPIIVAPAGDAPIVFNVYSNKVDQLTDVKWTMNNGQVDLAEMGFVDDNNVLTFKSPSPMTAFMPELSAKAGTESASYMFGEGEKNQLLALGNPDFLPLGNAWGKQLYAGFQDGESFGPSYKVEGVACNGVVEVFTAPIAPLYVKGVNVCVVKLEGKTADVIPAGKTMKATLYRIKDNKITNEVIATGTATPAEVTAMTNLQGGYNISFVFNVEEDGFVTETPAVIEGTNFAVVIDGFDASYNFNVVFTNANDANGGGAYTMHNGKLSAFADGDFNLVDMYISLDAVYNCLYVDESTNVLKVPDAGGLAVNENNEWGTLVYSSRKMDEAQKEIQLVDKSDWITKINYNDESYDKIAGFAIGLEGEALPAGLEGRMGSVTLESYGVRAVVKVYQGNKSVGITSNSVEVTKAVRNGEGFTLTYPNGVSSVQVINVAGQVVATYNLSANGTFDMPAANMASGLYMLKFNGENAQTIKIMK